MSVAYFQYEKQYFKGGVEMFYSLSNPWQEMEHIQNEMNRMFDLLPFGERSQYPPVNISTPPLKYCFSY